MKNILSFKHSIILALLFVFNSQLSIINCQYYEPEGTYSVANVTNDTLISFRHDGIYRDRSFVTAKGYFYVDYTALNAVDGTLQCGVIIKENGTTKFVPAGDAIVLSNSTAKTTINGTDVYLFTTIDGVTTWQFLIKFDMLPGAYPAMLYTKHSADNGSFRYKIEITK